MSYAPPTNVEEIPRQPLPFGLLSVLTPRLAADGRWQNGIIWEPLGCTPVSGIGDPACDAEETTGLPKQFPSEGAGTGEATPFTVYGSYKCSLAGHPESYAMDRATENLLAREEARVEQAIWTGDLDNLGFAEGAEGVGTGSIARSVARLEQWIASNYGSLGVIHMTVEAALLASEADVVKSNGTSLFTVLGTPVVAGAGYPGTGPTGQNPAEDTTYIYATPALMGYRSEPFPGVSGPGAGFDRGTNDIHAVTERTYVVGWDPCGTAFALANLPE